VLIIDFETRSKVDLKTAGAYTYAQDPSTEILCMGWRCGINGESGVWFPGDPVPKEVRRALRTKACLIAAWNANFDRLIWDDCEHPFGDLPLSRWLCLSATARVNALPAGLDDCFRCIFQGKRGKDVRGQQLIQTLCIPNADGTFTEDPELLKALGEYCLQDVLASYDCSRHMRPMDQGQRTEYHVNERINDSGVYIDVDFCEAATDYADSEREALSLELSRLTGGNITSPTQTQRIREYVYTRSNQEIQNMMTVYKNNEPKRSLDKRIRENIMAAVDDNTTELDPDVYAVIRCAHEGSNTSVVKFKRMVERADPVTHRACGAFMYAGASQTHRFASRGVQLHNFRRDTPDADRVATLRNAIMLGHPVKHPIDTLASMLRPAITAEPGNVLVVADWKQIEARALPWLSRKASAEPRLKIFADDEDIYQTTADALQAERQVGKVADLSLGFGGGAGAFTAMARNYGVTLPEHVVEQTVTGWRNANPWAVEFWRDLRLAATAAIKDPHQSKMAGRVHYRFRPDLLGGTLQCTLPCGNTIQYPFAMLEHDVIRDQLTISAIKANWTPAWGDKEWPRVRLWHGLLAENVTQATAASLLRYALTELHMRGWDIVAHVHDEIVLEVPLVAVEECIADVREVMEINTPAWTLGLPLGVDIKAMERYGK
jgi:DNA polymerase